jgi:hypothetical protein
MGTGNKQSRSLDLGTEKLSYNPTEHSIKLKKVTTNKTRAHLQSTSFCLKTFQSNRCVMANHIYKTVTIQGNTAHY